MEALARKLEETHDEIQHVQGEVIAVIKSYYASASALSAEDALRIASRWTTSTHFASLPQVADESDMKQRLQHLNEVLLGVVDAMQAEQAAEADSNLQQKLVASFAQRERLKRQLEQSRRMLALVDRVTQLDNLLISTDTKLDKGDLVAGAEGVAAAYRLLDEISGDQDRSATASEDATGGDEVLRILRGELHKKKSRIVLQLRHSHSRAFVWKSNALEVQKPQMQQAQAQMSPTSHTELLAVLWRAADAMDLAPALLQKFAQAATQHLIRPLFASDATSVKVSQELNGAFISIRAEDSSVAQDEVIPSRCKHVTDIFRFLHNDVLASDARLTATLGKLMWKSPGNVESQLLSFFQAKVPKEAEAVATYQTIVATAVRELESNLAAFGFDQVGSSQLHLFACQANELFAKKRREQLLVAARDLMGQDYRNSLKVTAATERFNIGGAVGGGKKGKGGGSLQPGSPGGGQDAVDDLESGSFQMPDYCVSACAHQVVEMVHQTLTEACGSDSTCASILFHTAREMVFLFRAVVPTLYGEEIANDSRTCMLFHNDCQYIAHHMLTIGHLYKQRLPAPLAQLATMVDMVPAFRQAGEQALILYCKMTLEEMLAGVKCLEEQGTAWADPVLSKFEENLSASLYRINHISSMWKHNLPLAVYNRVMGGILEPFVAKLLGRFLRESKISASASAKLHNLSSILLESETVFASPSQAEKFVPAFAKLRRFSEILVQPLATVQDRVQSGELNTFTKLELSALIKSVFRDSVERVELLRVIEATSNCA